MLPKPHPGYFHTALLYIVTAFIALRERDQQKYLKRHLKALQDAPDHQQTVCRDTQVWEGPSDFLHQHTVYIDRKMLQGGSHGEPVPLRIRQAGS